MVTYQKSDADIKILYQVEYLINYDESVGSVEDQTRVKKFDSLDDALTFYLVQFFRMCSYDHDDHDRVSDVKLFEQVVINDEVVRESWIEPESTTLYSLRQTFKDDTLKEVYDLRESIENVKETNEKYSAFVKAFKIEENFKQFVHQG